VHGESGLQALGTWRQVNKGSVCRSGLRPRTTISAISELPR
jgi:hypothetical protein